MEQRWDFPAIEAGSSALVTSMGETAHWLGECNAALGQLQATWGGDASEGYQVAQRMWDKASDDLNRALGDLGRAVSEAGTTMGSTETLNQGRFTP